MNFGSPSQILLQETRNASQTTRYLAAFREADLRQDVKNSVRLRQSILCDRDRQTDRQTDTDRERFNVPPNTLWVI